MSLRFGALEFKHNCYDSSKCAVALYGPGDNPYNKHDDSAVYFNGKKIGTSRDVYALTQKVPQGAVSQDEVLQVVKGLTQGEGGVGPSLNTIGADQEKVFLPRGEGQQVNGLEAFKKVNQHPRGFNPFIQNVENGTRKINQLTFGQ